MIPAVFERNNPGHASRILPAAEALMYALYWERVGRAGALSTSRAQQLVETLRRHTRALLLDRDGIGVEIEHPADARRQRGDVRWRRS